mgnify:CR=1 FL=1
MNIRKKQQGITLIALAVTIIVMLILAGVTIAALTSENGIINQANTAKETNKVCSENRRRSKIRIFKFNIRKTNGWTWRDNRIK